MNNSYTYTRKENTEIDLKTEPLTNVRCFSEIYSFPVNPNFFILFSSCFATFRDIFY